jgi:hypothetical protein
LNPHYLKPQSQLAVRASTGGLRVCFSKYRVGHARTPYNFYGSYGSCKYVRWLLDMHNNRYGFLAVSINVRDTHASRKRPRPPKPAAHVRSPITHSELWLRLKLPSYQYDLSRLEYLQEDYMDFYIHVS